MNKRLSARDRRDELLNAALIVAARPGGWAALTRASVAKEAQCSDALVSAHFGTMIEFRRSVMRAAIKRRALSVIAQGVASADRTALHAPPELKREAMGDLIGG